jgi:serine phosphatase RsbU (regulator of sigma subunit)
MHIDGAWPRAENGENLGFYRGEVCCVAVSRAGGGDIGRLRTDADVLSSSRGSTRLESCPRTAALRWYAGAYLLILGMSFLILPRGPINPIHGLVWFRGPFFVLSGLVVLWLAALPLSRRGALIAHALVAVPILAVVAQYAHLGNYGPAVTLFVLGMGIAASPLAPARPVSSGFRADALGIVLGLSLAGQGIVLLTALSSKTIPYGLQLEIGLLFTVFGLAVAACHLLPGAPALLRIGGHLAAGASAVALWVILALGYGPILWLLNVATLLVAAAFFALPWISRPLAGLAPNTVRLRLSGVLFNGALVPLLIAVPLVLAGGEGVSTTMRQMAFGVALGLGVAAAVAGWFAARVLVDPLSDLVHGVERIAAGTRPVTLQAGGLREVDELAAAVQTMSMELDEQMRALVDARDRHQAIAEKLQRALQAPVGKFPGIDVGTVYHSATEVAELGGDFYDVFRTTAGRIAILLGDVSGRGLDAAAQAVLTRASLRAFSYSTDSPAEVLSLANRLLVDTGSRGFVTVFFGLLDPTSGDLLYSMAGPPPPVLLRQERAGLRPASSPVLGVFESARFHDTHLQLTSADLLLLYTDGLTEAKKDGSLFGEERLVAEVEALAHMKPGDLARGLYALAVDHAGGTLADDVAIMALRIQNV